MSEAPDESEQEPTTFFEVGLDDVNVARLVRLSEATKIDPRTLLASLVIGVLEDDELSHEGIELLAPVDRARMN